MKYELTENTIEYENKTLYQIRALQDFADVKKGDLGGYIESVDNLSQEGDCWIYDRAKVYNSAKVYDNALIRNHAKILGEAKVYDSAEVYGEAEVLGEAKIHGNVSLKGFITVDNDSEIY